MIKLQNVCYVRLGTRDLESATRFSTDILGLETREMILPFAWPRHPGCQA